MKIKLLILSVAMLFIAASGSAQVCDIYISSVSNTHDDTSLTAGSSHLFTFGLQTFCSNSGTYNPTNGIKIYSPDGATWGPAQGVTLPAWDGMGWSVSFINHFNWDGAAFVAATPQTGPTDGGPVADAILFAGVSFSPTLGLPTDFQDDVYTIEFTSTSGGTDHLKHICIDSTFTPGGTWTWAAVGSGEPNIKADWAGPFCYRIWDQATGISDGDGTRLPTTFALAQNYPNPFNPETHITYDVPERAHVNITVFNVLGQAVKTLVDETKDAQAEHFVTWRGDTDGGGQAASGIYFYKLTSDETVLTKKMMLLK